MNTDKREYSGEALSSIMLGLGQSEEVIAKILAGTGVERIDPEAWYDFDWAISLFYKIEAEIGPAALAEVGRKMIEAASYPPTICDMRTGLESLGYWYAAHARGPDVGAIECTFEDDSSATLDWSARGPCAIRKGILEGMCMRFAGFKPLIEHGEGCMDHGAPTCLLHVSW